MQLITKNLTGYLENGERYRITFLNSSNKEVSKNFRGISVRQETFSEALNKWVLHDFIVKAYRVNPSSYKEALRDALLEAENSFNIDLLKVDFLKNIA